MLQNSLNFLYYFYLILNWIPSTNNVTQNSLNYNFSFLLYTSFVV